MRENKSYCSRMGLEKRPDMTSVGGKINKFLKIELKKELDLRGYSITQAISNFAKLYVDQAREERGELPFELNEVYKKNSELNGRADDSQS